MVTLVSPFFVMWTWNDCRLLYCELGLFWHVSGPLYDAYFCVWLSILARQEERHPACKNWMFEISVLQFVTTSTCHFHHLLLQQHPEWLDILVLAHLCLPGVPAPLCLPGVPAYLFTWSTGSPMLPGVPAHLPGVLAIEHVLLLLYIVCIYVSCTTFLSIISYIVVLQPGTGRT